MLDLLGSSRLRYVTLLSLYMLLVPTCVQGVEATSSGSSAGEQVKWHVISGGGTEGTSAVYRLVGTAGQSAVGMGSSLDYGITHGFWQEFGGESYVYGDANGDGSVDIDDVVFLINYIFADGPAPEPAESADVNCSGDIDIDDVVYLIAYIFSGGPPPGDPNDDGTPDC